MKRFVTVFATIVGACAFATLALAQDSSRTPTATVKDGNATIVSEPGTANLHLDELKAFGQVAQTHPDMAKALARKPALIKSDKFVAKYPDLQEFLGKFPDARDSISENPGDYVAPVSSSSWKHAPHGMKMSDKDGSAATKDGSMMNDPAATDGAPTKNGTMNEVGTPNEN